LKVLLIQIDGKMPNLALMKISAWHKKKGDEVFLQHVTQPDGIEILTKAGVAPHHLMFYELVGFNTTFEEDYHRFEVLTKKGIKPFIMIYNNRKDQPILRHFARWVNKRYYKVCEFRNYKPARDVKNLTFSV